MSYQKLNQVTHSLTFPIPCCDDTLQYINTESNYFIDVDMDSGYWQVVTEEEARKILAFFTPDENFQWKVMPVGDLNSAPIFVSMLMNI